MSTDLTNVFGTEINVALRPRHADRQYSGFPGVHGLTAMHMGSRGFGLIITGTMRADTRTLLDTAIAAVEQWLWAGAAQYTFLGSTYNYIVFERFTVFAGGNGKAFHWTAEDQVICRFVMQARGLI